MMSEPWSAVGVVPIFRIFDEAIAKVFYVDFLGCTIDWEHRYEPDMPLYMQVTLGGRIMLHLSGHHGDCTPGGALRIELLGIEAFHRTLSGKNYKYARPGLERNERERYVAVADPFGNRLTFFERIG